MHQSKIRENSQNAYFGKGNCLNFLKLSAHFLCFSPAKEKLPMESLTFCADLKCFIFAGVVYTVQIQNNSMASRGGAGDTNENLSVILECL